MLAWWIILAAIAVGPALHSWIKVYEFMKGKRSDLSQFVTRNELAQMKQERDQQISTTIADIKSDLDRVEKLMNDINRDLPAIHRALGRLEGHDDQPPRRG
jgi:uncharacterized protein HemX